MFQEAQGTRECCDNRWRLLVTSRSDGSAVERSDNRNLSRRRSSRPPKVFGVLCNPSHMGPSFITLRSRRRVGSNRSPTRIWIGGTVCSNRTFYIVMTVAVSLFALSSRRGISHAWSHSVRHTLTRRDARSSSRLILSPPAPTVYRRASRASSGGGDGDASSSTAGAAITTDNDTFDNDKAAVQAAREARKYVFNDHLVLVTTVPGTSSQMFVVTIRQQLMVLFV